MKGRRAIAILMALLTLFALGACAKPVKRPTPAPTDAEYSQADETWDEPEAPPFTGDVKAYLQAGLAKREAMTPVQKWYYYDRDSVDTVWDKYNSVFEESTTADLDGDGKDDAITLRFIDESSNPEFPQVNTVEIQVNDMKLKAAKPADFDFSGTGSITDIDAKDGKKELCIGLVTDDFIANYVIIYDKGQLRLLPKLWGGFDGADGSGYVTSLCFMDADALVPLRLNEDRTDLEEAGIKYFVTIESSFPEKDIKWESAETKWDQMLAKTPGGKEEIPVKTGTKIYFGLYDLSGWIQVLDADGKALGWLNMKATHYMEYTDYAIGVG